MKYIIIFLIAVLLLELPASAGTIVTIRDAQGGVLTIRSRDSGDGDVTMEGMSYGRVGGRRWASLDLGAGPVTGTPENVQSELRRFLSSTAETRMIGQMLASGFRVAARAGEPRATGRRTTVAGVAGQVYSFQAPGAPPVDYVFSTSRSLANAADLFYSYSRFAAASFASSAALRELDRQLPAYRRAGFPLQMPPYTVVSVQQVPDASITLDVPARLMTRGEMAAGFRNLLGR